MLPRPQHPQRALKREDSHHDQGSERTDLPQASMTDDNEQTATSDRHEHGAAATPSPTASNGDNIKVEPTSASSGTQVRAPSRSNSGNISPNVNNAPKPTPAIHVDQAGFANVQTGQNQTTNCYQAPIASMVAQRAPASPPIPEFVTMSEVLVDPVDMTLLYSTTYPLLDNVRRPELPIDPPGGDYEGMGGIMWGIQVEQEAPAEAPAAEQPKRRGRKPKKVQEDAKDAKVDKSRASGRGGRARGRKKK